MILPTLRLAYLLVNTVLIGMYMYMSIIQIRSANYCANTDDNISPTLSHSLNAKRADATCGRGSAQSYDPIDGWLDTYGDPMPWTSQATYGEYRWE